MRHLFALYEFILILDKNIEKSACLRRLKPFFEEGFKNPKNFKKRNDTGYKRTTSIIVDITMGPLPHWYGITIVCKVLVEE